jgi:hypothetical protein
MEAQGERVQLLLILDLGNRWGWVVSVTPRTRFSPGERTSATHCTGGWVGSRAGLDIEVRGKILCPRRESNLDHPVIQPVARYYTDWATQLTYGIYRLQYFFQDKDQEVNANSTFRWVTDINVMYSYIAVQTTSKYYFTLYYFHTDHVGKQTKHKICRS